MNDILTTDLHDAHTDQLSVCTLPFQNFGGRLSFSGPIRTVVTMEDTKLAQQLLRTPGDGAVIVLDGGGSTRTAMLGDVNAEILRQNNWAGIVINGVVRDSAELRGIDIGIKALGVTPIRSAKAGIGAIDVPVSFGNVLFRPGQYIYCDQDGVLIGEVPLHSPLGKILL
ncbi:ribonuclease E activity regulator RraA [Epibacterium sp. SM1979]|uniref:4-hydroxy-4-methyl-2-oxoglutarate aldolase n=1 Tax=Tritonibacter litoralis TaxID=2662264 RepID=A0A843YN55_9RHOB|nr:ribonuclease E activity regulator RraA [Tritonibacter litoralis]MQQ10662.1 ribonuclease E activity regulator RraA [Tritonibacter litoralis]